MKTINLPLDSITEYADNPRVIEKESIDEVAKSISEYGWAQPIVVDSDHVIVAGHVRYKAACKLKLEFAPCLVIHDKTHARKFRIADNRLGSLSGWDFEILQSEMSALEAEIGEIDLPGFTKNDIESMMAVDFGTIEDDSKTARQSGVGNQIDDQEYSSVTFMIRKELVSELKPKIKALIDEHDDSEKDT